MLLLLSVTGGTGLLIAGWAWMLRRKVAEQSAIIEQQNSTRATLEERQRIAREPHDTLEQELSADGVCSGRGETGNFRLSRHSLPAQRNSELNH